MEIKITTVAQAEQEIAFLSELRSFLEKHSPAGTAMTAGIDITKKFPIPAQRMNAPDKGNRTGKRF